MPAKQTKQLDRADMILKQVSSIETTDDAEKIADIHQQVKVHLDFAKDVEKMLKQAMYEWIEANKQDIVIGNVKYYIGPTTKTTLRKDKRGAAIEAILDAVGGDVDAFADMLSSQPLKHGAVRNWIDEATFDELFETVVERDVKTGKLAKTLKQINPDFVKKGSK